MLCRCDVPMASVTRAVTGVPGCSEASKEGVEIRRDSSGYLPMFHLLLPSGLSSAWFILGAIINYRMTELDSKRTREGLAHSPGPMHQGRIKLG